MSSESAAPPRGAPAPRRTVDATTVIGVLLFAGVLLGGLTWAKWWPYSHKLLTMLGTRRFTGTSVLAAAGKPSAAPSWHGAITFATTYGTSIWIALVAALLTAAGIETLLSRDAVVRVMTGRGWVRGSVAGGLLSLPCLMCTCCTAPLVVSLRRRGVPTSSSLAYWVGNPTLNPAVMAFLVIVLPWQYLATRLVIGALLVFGASAVVARLAPADRQLTEPTATGRGGQPLQLRTLPQRYLRALGRLALVLVPEYALVVLAIGAFRGWLLPLGNDALTWGIGAVIVAAVAGTLLVIPTAGEIPVIAGLAAAGFGTGVTGALVIALPALSLPSMVMVGRALSWRVTVAMAACVAVAAVAGGGLLSALGT